LQSGEEQLYFKAQLQYTNGFVKKIKIKMLYFSTEKPTVKAHKHDFAKKKKERSDLTLYRLYNSHIKKLTIIYLGTQQFCKNK